MMRAVVLDQSAGSSDSEIGTGNRLPVFVQERSLYFDRHLARRVQQAKQRFPRRLRSPVQHRQCRTEARSTAPTQH
jgi:hypothetical protein